MTAGGLVQLFMTGSLFFGLVASIDPPDYLHPIRPRSDVLERSAFGLF